MKGPESAGTIVRRIMREMQTTIAELGGDPGPIELWDEPPPPAPFPTPRLQLIKGGKAGPAPLNTSQPKDEPTHG